MFLAQAHDPPSVAMCADSLETTDHPSVAVPLFVHFGGIAKSTHVPLRAVDVVTEDVAPIAREYGRCIGNHSPQPMNLCTFRISFGAVGVAGVPSLDAFS